MATKQRLTKADIKQDKFISSVWKAQEYFTEHLTSFIIGAVAVVAVIVVVFVLLSSSQSREAAAEEILGRATVEFRGGNFQLAAVDYQSILDDYGGTDAARLASYYIANAYFALKNYDQAEEYFRLHLKKHKFDDMLSANALSGIGHCLRAKAQMQEAGESFYEVYKKYPDSYIVNDCLYYAAKSFITAGDSAKATEIYEIFSSLPAESQRSNELKLLMVEAGIADAAAGSHF